MSGVTYQRECLDLFWPSAVPLFAANAAEVPGLAGRELTLDRAAYQACEDAGRLWIGTARGPAHASPDGSAGVLGDLLAYAVFVVSRSPRLGVVQAHHECWYCLPGYRLGGVGRHLASWCEGALAADGVEDLFQAMPVGRGRLLQALGYRPVDTIYAKNLREG